MKTFCRRTFIQATTAALGGAITCPALALADPRTTIAAAVQFRPVLGDVDANLTLARKWVMEAVRQGAIWIVLPEFFTSGLAMHPSMFKAARPLDGAPATLLKEIANKHHVYVGGSFLMRSGQDVFNTFALAAPGRGVLTHDKDFPSTGYESSFYAGGEDAAYAQKLRNDGAKTLDQTVEPRADNNTEGTLETDNFTVGAALCWELVRYRTSRRLRDKIDLLLGASGWWWSAPDLGWPGRTEEAIAQDRQEQLNLIREAPRRQARMLGVPVVHANFVGDNPGFSSSQFTQPATGRYLGQSQIVDANGEAVEFLGEEEEGVAVAEVKVGRRMPLEAIPQGEFWMPEVNRRGRELWTTTGAQGRDYYLTNTRRRSRE